MAVAARLCSPCEVAWPTYAMFLKCPGCGRATEYETPSAIEALGLEVVGLDEAKQKAVDLAKSRDARRGFHEFCFDRTADHPEIAAFRVELATFTGVT